MTKLQLGIAGAVVAFGVGGVVVQSKSNAALRDELAELRGRDGEMAALLRAVRADVVTLAAGAALMLGWAGIVEAFFSQYHEPVLPYAVKIAFGVVEPAALAWYLARAGKDRDGDGDGKFQTAKAKESQGKENFHEPIFRG